MNAYVVRPLWQATSRAGPSRLGLHARHFAVSATRPAKITSQRASTGSPSQRVATPAAAAPKPKSAVSAASLPRTLPKARTLEDAWPWHRVPSPPAAPGTIEEERVIFARPYEGPLGKRVKLLWILGPFYIIVLGFYFTTPSLPTPEEVKEIENGTREDVRKELASRVVWTPVSIVSMTVLSLASILFMLAPSRVVTRLTQVRVRPDTSTPPSITGIGVRENQFIRMSHGGHLMMWGKRARPRELAMDQVSVNMLHTRQSSPWLDVSVNVPHKSKYNWDSVPYRLDFRDTKALNEGTDEMVLSLPRLEAVFGRLG